MSVLRCKCFFDMWYLLRLTCLSQWQHIFALSYEIHHICLYYFLVHGYFLKKLISFVLPEVILYLPIITALECFVACLDSNRNEMPRNLFAKNKPPLRGRSDPRRMHPSLSDGEGCRARSPCAQNLFPFCSEFPIWFPPLHLEMEKQIPSLIGTCHVTPEGCGLLLGFFGFACCRLMLSH